MDQRGRLLAPYCLVLDSGVLMRKTLLLSLVLVSILATAQAPRNKTTKLPQDTHPLTSQELRSIGTDFVQALGNFYMATHIDQPWENEVQMMTTIMNDNRWLRDGVLLIKKYRNHPNQVIRVATEGTILGAEMAQESNNDILAIMRNPSSKSVEEIRYQVALYGSRQKEAYGLILRSAPWVTGAMFRPRTSKEQAAIPYTISKPDRQAIVREIDKLFGEELAAEERGERKDRHNAIVLAARAIRKNLVGETYAEIQEPEDEAPTQ